MNKLTFGGALALCAFFAAMGPAASAQMGMQQPAIRGIFNPTVGSGAQYEMDKADGSKMTIELSIVGKDSVGGKDAYWMETSMASTQTGGDIIVKMHIIVDGPNSHADQMVMQTPGRGPMSMPMAMMQGRGPQQPEDVRDKADDLGKESVTVPAGTFSCEHYKLKDGTGDVWVSQNISPYGLVKMQGKDVTMVLAKQLTGVQDKITGTPMDMGQMMRGMGAPPQQ
jgi:hypothetical protein